MAQTPIYKDSTASVEDRVNDLFSRMSLDEKIGQMTQADLTALSNIADVKNYLLGSVLSGGGSDPADNSAVGWADMYDGMQAQALQTFLKIPMIYGVDAVHGHNNVYGAVVFPHNIGLGCTRNPQLIKRMGQITAEEVAATGIDWTFAPCVAVVRDERWGRTYESFGETPEINQLMGSAEISGLQGDTLSNLTSILATVKHYIGDGG
ncbi:MAG: glycoside hydrolase family 3 N-terminal domain-containing protein, partial [Ignavibacteria bacterium]|nr:glycoside hydrolase family 3 N-terminal domain-containing protein [Ignavibacteria bacterium]